MEQLKYKGAYLITAKDASTGKILWAERFDNLLTQINQQVRVQQLLGTYTGPFDQLQLKYFAFGTGTTAPAVTDTALETEIFRKAITQVTNPAPGVVQTIVSLNTSEANFTIREIGVFAGSDATGTPGSGLLVSRVAVNIQKNSNIILNVVRTDTCTI